MADEEDSQAPAPQGSNVPPAPQDPLLPQNPQVAIVPNVPPALIAPKVPTPHIPQLHWSLFKPKYLGKPDKDAEAHLLGQMTWWTCMDFQTTLRYRDFDFSRGR